MKSLLLNLFIQIFLIFNSKFSWECRDSAWVFRDSDLLFLDVHCLTQSISLYWALIFLPVLYLHALLRACLCWDWGIASLWGYSGDEDKTKVEQHLFCIWALITVFCKLEQRLSQTICMRRILLLRSRRLTSLWPAAFVPHSFWDRFHVQLDGTLHASLNFLEYPYCQSQRD